MERITGDEYAFPTSIDHPNYKAFGTGLTIRQHFAAMAMQGIMSSWNRTDMPETKGIELAVKTSVEISDALIAELNKSR